MQAGELGRSGRAVESPAWIAGVSFGRARHEPTPAEREVWRQCGRLREFLRGLRHGQTMEPRRVQAELALD